MEKKSKPGAIVIHVDPKHMAAVANIGLSAKHGPIPFNNFLISGSGRSGTRFLANLMDKSEI